VIKTIFRQSEADPMWIYPYLLHYPIHTTQKLVHDDPQSQQLTIELQMEVDVELKAFLMRYSNELEVLEPISLRKEIIGRLSQALAHYSK
jgi:predicted DNA-binding transcriptional regulator YafY